MADCYAAAFPPDRPVPGHLAAVITYVADTGEEARRTAAHPAVRPEFRRSARARRAARCPRGRTAPPVRRRPDSSRRLAAGPDRDTTDRSDNEKIFCQE